jgi:hypothetical protein
MRSPAAPPGRAWSRDFISLGTLVAMSIGNFDCAFFNDAFLGVSRGRSD